MTVEHVGLADYVAIASEVTGLDIETILRFPRLGLADSALHVPAAGFGDACPTATNARPGSPCASSRSEWDQETGARDTAIFRLVRLPITWNGGRLAPCTHAR